MSIPHAFITRKYAKKYWHISGNSSQQHANSCYLTTIYIRTHPQKSLANKHAYLISKKGVRT
jgi:hypothetical protein